MGYTADVVIDMAAAVRYRVAVQCRFCHTTWGTLSTNVPIEEFSFEAQRCSGKRHGKRCDMNDVPRLVVISSP